jgi:hypothetical protein
VTKLAAGVWCALVSEPKTGAYEDSGCSKGKSKGPYIKVLVREMANGPRWAVEKPNSDRGQSKR